MILRSAAKGVVRGKGTYNIGFNDDDETQFDATSFADLEGLWRNFCKEEGCREDSVDYAERA